MALIAHPLHQEAAAAPIPPVCNNGLDLKVLVAGSICEDSSRIRSDWAMMWLQLTHMEDRVECREAGRKSKPVRNTGDNTYDLERPNPPRCKLTRHTT